MSGHPGLREVAATVVAPAAWSGLLVLVVGEIVLVAVTDDLLAALACS